MPSTCWAHQVDPSTSPKYYSVLSSELTLFHHALNKTDVASHRHVTNVFPREKIQWENVCKFPLSITLVLTANIYCILWKGNKHRAHAEVPLVSFNTLFWLQEPTVKLTNVEAGKANVPTHPQSRHGSARCRTARPRCSAALCPRMLMHNCLFLQGCTEGRRVPRSPHGLSAPLARLCPARGPEGAAGGAAGPPRGCGARAGTGGVFVRRGHLGRDGSYSPGGFTAAGVAILSLRRIKTNARGAEGCSEQPGGGAAGAGSRRQGGRAGRSGGGGCSRQRTGGAARSVRGGPRCPMAPRRLCSCAALSEHVPGGRTCALGPWPPMAARDPPQEPARAAPDTAPDRPPPSGLEPAAPGASFPQPGRCGRGSGGGCGPTAPEPAGGMGRCPWPPALRGTHTLRGEVEVLSITFKAEGKGGVVNHTLKWGWRLGCCAWPPEVKRRIEVQVTTSQNREYAAIRVIPRQWLPFSPEVTMSSGRWKGDGAPWVHTYQVYKSIQEFRRSVPLQV